MRATRFGDIIFIDHCEVKYQGSKYLVLLVLDGATTLLAAYSHKQLSDEMTTKSLREWMETYMCNPKALCADMAFGSSKMKAFYEYHRIRHLPTGPHTPWPNRAETAVRLFKHHLANLIVEIENDPSLEGVTARSIMRKAAWARNSTVTYAGRTPLELAFGRRPRDIVSIENSSPSQLTFRT